MVGIFERERSFDGVIVDASPKQQTRDLFQSDGLRQQVAVADPVRQLDRPGEVPLCRLQLKCSYSDPAEAGLELCLEGHVGADGCDRLLE